jgi:hypothetical protein
VSKAKRDKLGLLHVLESMDVPNPKPEATKLQQYEAKDQEDVEMQDVWLPAQDSHPAIVANMPVLGLYAHHVSKRI